MCPNKKLEVQSKNSQNNMKKTLKYTRKSEKLNDAIH